MKKKLIMFFLGTLLLVSNTSVAYAATDIDWNNKLTQGTNISYKIFSDCEYTSSIPNAVSKLQSPSGMRNPLTISSTSTSSASKMDFHQKSVADGTYATTYSYRKNSSGVYYCMPNYEKDSYDWVYGEVYLNDKYMSDAAGCSTTTRQGIIIHEMLHVYGCKDISNVNSIMNSYPANATTLTTDANNVLNNKY
ncbi:MAG: hypothetical protein AB6733_14265 [Clostridiaceae bacterium]